LEIVALVRYANDDSANTGPRVEPRAEGVERGQVASTRASQRDEEQASDLVTQGRRARALTVIEQPLHAPREFTAETAT